jgi:hypothetical protein
MVEKAAGRSAYLNSRRAISIVGGFDDTRRWHVQRRVTMSDPLAHWPVT